MNILSDDVYVENVEMVDTSELCVDIDRFDTTMNDKRREKKRRVEENKGEETKTQFFWHCF